MNAVNLMLDTRDKKPKIVNVAVLTGAVVVLLILLQLFGRREDYLPEGIVLTIYFLAVTVLLVRAFFLQMQYNLYSYNTIIYFGFALFTLFIAITYLRLVLLMCAFPQYTAMNLVANLLSSGLGVIVTAICSVMYGKDARWLYILNGIMVLAVLLTIFHVSRKHDLTKIGNKEEADNVL